ncbi:MAG: PAS domain S-box protein [Deltaproteobacteria bacterium]|nr:PAS domain S-box protein [Deltaproteobacteria bacterium]
MNVPNKTKINQAKDKYRHLFNSLGDAIFVHDMNGRILDANDYACQRYGYSYEKFKTMQIKDVDTPEQAKHIENRIKKLLKNGQITFETIHLDSHNREFPVEATAKLGKYEGQQVVLVIGHDITKRKQAEKALNESRYMLQTVLDSIPAAVFWKDQNLIYLGGNRTWLATTGINSSEEVAGKSDYDLPWSKEESDSFRENDRRIMKSGIPEYDIIEPYLRSNGTQAWAKTNKVPLRDTEGKIVGILGTYEDITERKNAEDALKEAKNVLEIKVLERTSELDEVNTALKVLIKNRDMYAKEMEDKIRFEIHEIVTPNLDKLKKSKLNNNQRMLIEVIKNKINQVTVDFDVGILNKHLTLTPSEIKVANLIKHGKTNKEIAKLHNSSVRTVESHRASIRRKIGIKNKKMSIRSYLMNNL